MESGTDFVLAAIAAAFDTEYVAILGVLQGRTARQDKVFSALIFAKVDRQPCGRSSFAATDFSNAFAKESVVSPGAVDIQEWGQ